MKLLPGFDCPGPGLPDQLNSSFRIDAGLNQDQGGDYARPSQPPAAVNKNLPAALQDIQKADFDRWPGLLKVLPGDVGILNPQQQPLELLGSHDLWKLGDTQQIKLMLLQQANDGGWAPVAYHLKVLEQVSLPSAPVDRIAFLAWAEGQPQLPRKRRNPEGVDPEGMRVTGPDGLRLRPIQVARANVFERLDELALRIAEQKQARKSQKTEAPKPKKKAASVEELMDSFDEYQKILSRGS